MTAVRSPQHGQPLHPDAAPETQQPLLRIAGDPTHDDDQGAPTRTHAREATSVPQEASATDWEPVAELDGPPLKDRLVAWAHPPNVRQARPLTWLELKEHALTGEHLPQSGWPRTAAVIWSRCVTLPVRVAVLYVDWISQSISRTAVALVIYALLAHLAPFAWLPWPGFLP